MFDSLIGQEQVKKYFLNAMNAKAPPQSILLHGPSGTGKAAAAIEWARIVMCRGEGEKPCGDCNSCSKISNLQHPDVLLFFPVPGKITPEEVEDIKAQLAENPYSEISFEKAASLHIGLVQKDIKKRLQVKSYQAGGRVVILLDIEKMTTEAANALLKLLEEPSEDVTIILTTSSMDNLLPTIKSRCQHVRFSFLPDKAIEKELIERDGASKEDASLWASLASGSYSRARAHAGKDFVKLQDVCDNIIRASVNNKPLESIEVAEEISLSSRKSGSNDVNLRALLNLLLLTLKTAFESKLSGNDSDTKSKSVALLVKYPIESIESAIIEVEKSIDLLDKNAYIYLIMLILLNKLRKLFIYA